MSLTVTINGEPESVRDGLTVAELVAQRRGGGTTAAMGRGIAVALNGEVVPRSEWDATGLDANDVIEILNAVGGG